MNRSIRFGTLAIALALAGSLRAEDKAPPAAPADPQASLRADNKQLTDELAAAWKESADLKAKVDQLTADYATQGQQLDALKAQLAAKPEAAPAAAAPDSSQLADVQDKLATSLRSFTVVQDENSQLKASLDKLTSDNAAIGQQLDAARASIATLQVQAAATSQIEPLRNELRQAQDESNRLATENAAMRTRIAVQSPGPGAARPMPPASCIVSNMSPISSCSWDVSKCSTGAAMRSKRGSPILRISRIIVGQSGVRCRHYHAAAGSIRESR